MMQKIITRLQDWVDVKLRNHCDRLPKSTQRKIVLAMLGIFAFFPSPSSGTAYIGLGKTKDRKWRWNT